MADERIIGREPEKKLLGAALKSSNAEFIAIYGRRRVGKTFLVREFFASRLWFELTGQYDGALEEQLGHFARSLATTLGLEVQLKRPESWSEAFEQLAEAFEKTRRGRRGGKRVLFLDELPWLDTPRSGFLSGLEYFWNTWASRQKDLLLVVCGSAASWMIREIVNSTGGLHNRLTRQMALQPFLLNETEKFLRGRGVKLTRHQIVELYMTIGGIPHYLKEAEPGLSAAQIIDKTCFSSSGLLRHEFAHLYASLFQNSENHERIVKALFRKKSGLTRTEILKAAKLKSGGTATLLLEELEQSGFIQSQVPFGRKTKDALYRLSDEFTLFHLQWIEPLGKRSPGPGYWLRMQSEQRRRIWAGYAFEGICIKHVEGIKRALGISGLVTSEVPWRFDPPRGSKEPGAQIDLLIDRPDKTINVCEMKFHDAEFRIEKRQAAELRRKLDVFRRISKTRKNLFLTFVTSHGLAWNEHAKELVANAVGLDALFLA